MQDRLHRRGGRGGSRRPPCRDPATLWPPLRTASSRPVSAAKADRPGHVGRVGRVDDEGRPAVEAGVVDPARRVVARVTGQDDGAVQGGGERRDRVAGRTGAVVPEASAGAASMAVGLREGREGGWRDRERGRTPDPTRPTRRATIDEARPPRPARFADAASPACPVANGQMTMACSAPAGTADARIRPEEPQAPAEEERSRGRSGRGGSRRRSSVVAASSRAWRRGDSTWRIPASRWDRTVGIVRDHHPAAAGGAAHPPNRSAGVARRPAVVVARRSSATVSSSSAASTSTRTSISSAVSPGRGWRSSRYVTKRRVAVIARRWAVGSSPTTSARRSTSATRYGRRAAEDAPDLEPARARRSAGRSGRRRTAPASRISAIVPMPVNEIAPCADLATLPDQDDPERRRGLEAVADHRPVAVLEDVEGQGDAGAQDGVEREERQFHPAASRAAWRGVRPGVSLRESNSRRNGPAAGGGGERRRPAPGLRWSVGAGPGPSRRRPRSGSWSRSRRPTTAFGLFTVKPAPMSVST